MMFCGFLTTKLLICSIYVFKGERKLMKEKLTVLIGEKEIQSRVEKLAAEISESYKGESLLVVGILRGAIMFMVDLLKKLEINDVQIDFMAVSSYGSSTVSSGKINIKKDLSESIEGRNVLIVEDIIDTGNTLYHLIEYLKKDNPKSVKLCTLFDKPERREKEVPVDWVGFDIPNKFIVGYGLDYAQRYRNLPYIAELAFIEDEDEK